MTQIVGILNITPDSFSDGGQYNSADSAMCHMQHLIDAGADMIDIGAESTRPNATPVQAEEEINRLAILPELVAIAHEHGVRVSLDTRHARTAAYALSHHVDCINDVSGGSDDAMLAVIAAHDCDYIIMHSLTIPADKSIIIPPSDNVVEVVKQGVQNMIMRCVAYGIARERLIADVGLGFGKNAEQSLTLLWHIPALQTLHIPLYYGHSRKSCFAPFILKDDSAARDNLTLLASHYLMSHGVNYLRVHDVDRHVRLRNQKNYSIVAGR
jgi:dihydropteroate synthase